MIFNFEEKPSASPYVEVIWRNHSESGGQFISMATSHWQMVITKHKGKTTFTIRGPESKATQAYCPPEAEHFGFYLKHGVVMPSFPAIHLRDGMVDLPGASSDSFWLNSSTWQFPDYENVDNFIARLVHDGLLIREPVVDSALEAQPPVVSVRSVQRRFLKATGLTRGILSQIDRARYAANLLKQGVSILDTVELAGYADQPHLTRSLKFFIGQTPAQLIREDNAPQLSFLSKFDQIPEY